jgi:hypothetical protein
MPTNDQAQADQTLDTSTADGNASASEAQTTASDNQPATTANTAPATEGVAAMDDYMKRLQEALEPATDEDAAHALEQAGDNPPATKGNDAPPANDASQDTPPATDAVKDTLPASEDDTAQGKREFRPRLSGLDDRQKEAILLVKELKDKGQTLSLAEAEARVNAKYGVTSHSEKQTEAAPPALTPEDLKAQIDQLKADRRKAAADMDTLKIAEFSEQIEDLQMQYLDARESAKNADLTAEQQFQQQVSESWAKTESVYPAAADHAIHAEAERIWAVMQEQKNPIISDADAPFKVYQMAANALGIAPSSSSPKSSPAPTPRPQAVQQSAVVRRTNPQSPVASGGDRTTTPTTASPLPNGFPRSTFEYEQMIHSIT